MNTEWPFLEIQWKGKTKIKLASQVFSSKDTPFQATIVFPPASSL